MVGDASAVLVTLNVLLATDGSPSARSAETLVANTVWPTPTRIDVLHVDQFLDGEIDLPAPAYEPVTAARRQATDARLAAIADRLAVAGRTVRARVAFGRPASTIVAEARALGSDLIVVGSHGHGQLASTLLGSVAAEVADHAPCPVLVARTDRLSRVVLGHDGSEGSLRAEQILVSIAPLARLPVDVVSVARPFPLWYGGGEASTGWYVDGEVAQQMLDDERAALRSVVQDAMRRLRERGQTATAEVREGPAAASLLEAARERHADLIVVGSRGNTGLARLLLGSVARGVLYHATCSVLIVPKAAAVAPEVEARA